MAGRNCMPETRLVFKIETFFRPIQFRNEYMLCGVRVKHKQKKRKICERVKVPTNGSLPSISSHTTIQFESGSRIRLHALNLETELLMNYISKF